MAKLSAKEIEKLVKEHRERLEEHFNAPAQPKIMTMAPKVAVEVAMPGWQAKGWYEDRRVYNLPPIGFQEQADAIVECVKAGAAVVHTHPRDPETGLTAPVYPPSIRHRHVECLSEVMDRAHDKVDFVTAHHTWTWDDSKRDTDYVTDTKELLEEGQKKGIGNFYVQLAMIMSMPGFGTTAPVHTREAIIEGTKWFESNSIKPMFSCESFAIDRFNQILFQSGVAKWTPFWLAIQEGKHDDDRTFADPWCAFETMASVGLAKTALGDKVMVGFHPAGRNWLQVAANALLHGAEFIRVGIEDQFYLYPHRDDISRMASDTTRIMVDLIHALGREVATPAEVRRRAKIKLTK
ncbi:MAG: 3-keto-5-aminohexanoate cleavage protein [Chloroflexi bacterium]|nr:3-keto-5-aminohexanoate cleavage protein [Chloroflexota bacterium]